MSVPVPSFPPVAARRGFFFAVLVLSALAAARPAGAWPGDPDLRFGTGGVVATPFWGPGWPVEALAVQSDGKIIAAGGSRTSFNVGRLKDDGTPDFGFGIAGLRVTALTSGQAAFSRVSEVALQPDGKILVAGFIALDESSRANAALVRYLPDGSHDPSFGNGGIILTGLPDKWNVGSDLALLSDGKILVLGNAQVHEAPYFISTLLYRFLPDGTPDPAFGTGGLVQLPDKWVWRMAVQPDGKIVFGSSESDGKLERLRLARYDANGNPDPAFGTGGKVADDIVPGWALQFKEIALQNDGKILVAANAVKEHSTNIDFQLARFNPDGSLDTSFHGTGRVITDISAGLQPTNDIPFALAVQPDGKPVVAGIANDGFAIVRYQPDGSPDVAFGAGGISTTGPKGFLLAMALQPDGKIVTGGGPDLTVLARTLARPQLPLEAEWPEGTALTFGKTVDFAPVAKSSPYPPQITVTLINKGAAPVTGLAAAFEGPDASRFTLVSTVPSTLAGFASVPLTLQFNPPSAVDTFEAVLSITTDAPEIDGVAFGVRATTAAPVATLVVFDDHPLITLETVDFGKRIPSQGGATRTLTLKNEGNIDLMLQGVSLGDAGTPGDFTVGTPETAVLAPGATTPLAVTFLPGGPGVRTATLRIASTDTFNPPWEIHLKGTRAEGLDAFRLTYFGTVDNFTWPSADSSDADRDGMWNMLEYALMTNPIVPNPTPWELVKNGDVLEFTITRPSDAEEFVGYALQWSVSPDTGPWFFSYEEPVILSDDGARQRVMFPVHAGFSGRRFVRLQVQKRPR